MFYSDVTQSDREFVIWNPILNIFHFCSPIVPLENLYIKKKKEEQTKSAFQCKAEIKVCLHYKKKPESFSFLHGFSTTLTLMTLCSFLFQKNRILEYKDMKK